MSCSEHFEKIKFWVIFEGFEGFCLFFLCFFYLFFLRKITSVLKVDKDDTQICLLVTQGEE